MNQLDFNYLPRITRERFVRALASLSADGPLLSRPDPLPPIGAWYFALVVALGAVVALGLVGFGGIATPVQDRRYLGGYVVACALLGLAVAMIARRRAVARILPFPAGVYVLPYDLVDARSREMDLYPLSELLSVDPVHHSDRGAYSYTALWLVFPAHSFAFEVRGVQRAEELHGHILNARQRLILAEQRGDFAEIGMLDPFVEARAYQFQPIQEEGLLAESMPIWADFVWAVAIVSGLLLGVGAWRGRNALSDARAFSTLSSKPEPQAVLRYLSAGGLRSDALKASVLPRARFAEAKKETGEKRAEAIDRFLKDYPRSEVDAEAKAALAEAIHAELVTKKTVADLRGFVNRWPASPDVPTAKARIHERYQAALADLRQHASSDKNVLAVVEGAFAWVEQKNDGLEVRFRRKSVRTLATTDKLLGKNLLDDDGPAKEGSAEVGPFFASERLADREAALVRGLEKAFRGVFGDDLLPLKVGAPITDDESSLERPTEGDGSGSERKKRGAGKGAAARPPPLPEVPQPAMIVDYDIGWNGLTYVTRDRRRRFVGLLVKCDVTLAIPSPARALSFSLRAGSPDELSLEALDDRSAYDALLTSAFDAASRKLAPIVFDAKTAAARAPDPM